MPIGSDGQIFFRKELKKSQGSKSSVPSKLRYYDLLLFWNFQIHVKPQMYSFSDNLYNHEDNFLLTCGVTGYV